MKTNLLNSSRSQFEPNGLGEDINLISSLNVFNDKRSDMQCVQ